MHYSQLDRWRALAGLGALLLIIFLWPYTICVAAGPIRLFNIQTTTTPTTTTITRHVLNRTDSKIDRYSESDDVVRSIENSINLEIMTERIDNETIDSIHSVLLSRTERSVINGSNVKRTRLQRRTQRRTVTAKLAERNERSVHLTGSTRKIQLYIKNRLLQLLPNGIVNGTQDENSDYTILQRGAVDVGQIRIQGVATCLFLCMDACGNVYGSKHFTDDCIFNETMQHSYNIYSSTYHSNAQKTFYLALNKAGHARRTHLPANKELGKLATYAKAFTFSVKQNRSESLVARIFGPKYVTHGLRQLCDSGRALHNLTTTEMKRDGCLIKKLPGMVKPISRKQPGPKRQQQQRNQSRTRNKQKCTEDLCKQTNSHSHSITSKNRNNRKSPKRTGTGGNIPPRLLPNRKKIVHLTTGKLNQLKKQHGGGKTKRKGKEMSTTVMPVTTPSTDRSVQQEEDGVDELDPADDAIASSTESRDDVDEYRDTSMPPGHTASLSDDDVEYDS